LNAIQAARLGLGTVTHFYGHFEALMRDYVVQPWPADMNYDNEQWRFGQVARLWDKIHAPGSPEWNAYLQEHLKLGTVFNPTMTAYAAGRDVMALRSRDWHARYTLPSLIDFYTPSLTNHGAYFHDWKTEDEVAWRNFFQVWFRLLNDYKRMGGRVTVGSDAGFIYNTYGFGTIHEMELLQEAGFHPLEVIQAATMNPAMSLHEPKGKPIDFGVVRPRTPSPISRCSMAPAPRGSTSRAGRSSRWAACATRSRTASSTTRSSSWPMSRPWSSSRSRSAPWGEGGGRRDVAAPGPACKRVWFVAAPAGTMTHARTRSGFPVVPIRDTRCDW
jgi:hypothetical protein